MKENLNKKAVVLLSGGLDSTTVLALAKSQGYQCYALSFRYGQRHEAEILAAKKIAESFSCAEHRLINLDFLGELGGSALTSKNERIPDHQIDSDLIPVTYVPARNTIFLSIALGWAEVLGADDIFIGASAVDYSGYPDCRPEYMESFESLANLALKKTVTGSPIRLHRPLVHLSKAQTVQLGISLGVDYSKTISCYQFKTKACGTCDSCLLRAKGFYEANLRDPTVYVTEPSLI
jgi:7-cyano-7-deazaguanine synthase